MEPTNQGEATKLSQVIQIDEGKIQEHLGEVVRSTVEETLNAMLDAEADRLCRAEPYERTEARRDTRAGSYQRHLETKAGEVTLRVPCSLHCFRFCAFRMGSLGASFVPRLRGPIEQVPFVPCL